MAENLNFHIFHIVYVEKFHNLIFSITIYQSIGRYVGDKVEQIIIIIFHLIALLKPGQHERIHLSYLLSLLRPNNTRIVFRIIHLSHIQVTEIKLAEIQVTSLVPFTPKYTLIIWILASNTY